MGITMGITTQPRSPPAMRIPRHSISLPAEAVDLIERAAAIHGADPIANPSLARGSSTFCRLALAEYMQRHPPDPAKAPPPGRRRISSRSEAGYRLMHVAAPDALWQQAQALAAQQGVSVSKLITDAALAKARRVLAQAHQPTQENTP